MKFTEDGLRLAVIGATGVVGRTFLNILETTALEVADLTLYASEQSGGKELKVNGNDVKVTVLRESTIKEELDIAFFSAGSGVSKQYAYSFARNNTWVIDNSSAFRMVPEVPLVVPEVNFNTISAGDYIIANPNCSTIQLVVILAPLAEKYGLKRVVVSTYQAVSGAGEKALQQLTKERHDEQVAQQPLGYPIVDNVIPEIGDLDGNGYFTEELKLINETRKILGLSDLDITATAARVPVKNGHSESVNVELESDVSLDELKSTLRTIKGAVFTEQRPPMPVDADGRNEVLVGRIREDLTHKNAFNLWVVADNLRKGAALNGYQIAELLKEHKFV